MEKNAELKNDKKLFFPQISECTHELAQMQW